MDSLIGQCHLVITNGNQENGNNLTGWLLCTWSYGTFQDFWLYLSQEGILEIKMKWIHST